MTYTPDHINLSTNPDVLKTGAERINTNFDAIAYEILASINGLAYQNPVISIGSAAPVAPELGDRYIVAAFLDDQDPWFGHIDEIAEYVDTDTWEFYVPSAGWCCTVLDEGQQFVYNEEQWNPLPVLVTHNDLAELDGGTDGEYYHLDKDTYDALSGTGTPSDENLFVTADTLNTGVTTHTHNSEDSAQIDYGDLDNIPSTFTPAAHSHSKTDITDFAHTHGKTDITDFAHASGHVKGDGDEIDGDKLDIDFNPSYYTPGTVTEADNVDHLSAHLHGIDLELYSKSDTGHTHSESDISDLGSYALTNHDHDSDYSAIDHTHSYASTDHDATHITGASDEIDGDKLDIDWEPANYTPTTVSNYADSVDNLTAHLKGIDTAIGGIDIDTEAVQDIVGGMFTSNTAVNLTTSYDDTGGKVNVSPAYPSTWYWADTSFYAKTVSVAADRYTLLSPNAIQIDIGGSSYTLSTQVSIDLSVATNWDDYADDGDWDSTNYTTASNRAGKDFYVYAVQPDSGTVPAFLLSTNSTVPLGDYSESTSRKIGGFHCLCASMSTPGTRANNTAYALGATILSGQYWYRCSTAGTSAGSPPTLGTTIGGTTTDGTAVWVCEPIHPASGYLTGDIIPNSVWDLKFRAAGNNNAGLAYVEPLDQWWFIYLQSGVGASTASVYNGTITDTRMWFNHVDDLGNRKAILPDDLEFQIASLGSNQKTNISTTAEFHNTGGHTDTAGRRMISNYFLEDMCGGLWQWLRDQCFQVGSGSPGWKDVVGGLNGQVYLVADNAHIKVFAGGSWASGVGCGSRSRGFSYVGWGLDAGIGARGSCHSLKK